jgi:CheY-like chemotaxis protein
MIDQFKNAVICVDDDPLILQVLSFQMDKHINKQETLSEYFSDPTVALSHVKELIEASLPIACAIIDYQMPQMNGAQLIREIKKLDPSIKIIMLSGQANTVQIDDLLNEHLLDVFVSKPWDEKELFAVVDTLFGPKL